MKKSIKKTAMALVLSSTLLFSVAGCANGSNEEVPEGFTGITFYYDPQTRGDAEYRQLIETYNRTQGQTDKVKVSGRSVSGVTSSAQTHMMRNNAPNVVTVGDKSFKSLAVQDLMLSLEE